MCLIILIEFKHVLSIKAVQTTVVGAVRDSKAKHRVSTLW